MVYRGHDVPIIIRFVHLGKNTITTSTTTTSTTTFIATTPTIHHDYPHQIHGKDNQCKHARIRSTPSLIEPPITCRKDRPHAFIDHVLFGPLSVPALRIGAQVQIHAHIITVPRRRIIAVVPTPTPTPTPTFTPTSTCTIVGRARVYDLQTTEGVQGDGYRVSRYDR